MISFTGQKRSPQDVMSAPSEFRSPTVAPFFPSALGIQYCIVQLVGEQGPPSGAVEVPDENLRFHLVLVQTLDPNLGRRVFVQAVDTTNFDLLVVEAHSSLDPPRSSSPRIPRPTRPSSCPGGPK